MRNPMRSILIVEDEPVIRNTLREFLETEGFPCQTAPNFTEALKLGKSIDFHVAICDVQLPDGDGLDLLKRLLQMQPHLFVILITAYATLENAVDAFKAGAYDYLVKPILFDDLLHKLQRLFQFRQLLLENQELRRELTRYEKMEELVGSSRALAEVQAAIRKVAVTNCNVLLEGESGTGKELFARAIHRAGPKNAEKFLPISCGAVAPEQLEPQLFGTLDKTVAGALVLAGEGTVYFDEISQMPLSTQAKLLRAIEYREIIPVGGAEPVRVNARIIASTTRDLIRDVAEAKFQEDLFYRLNGTKIRIPPLRERLDDIPELVEHFLAKHSRITGKRVTSVSSDTMRILMSARWKGNVRQLDNAIERAIIMCEGTQIDTKDLPTDLLGIGQPLPATDDLRSALRHYERLHITRVLRQFPDKREAAKRLCLGLSSLYRKIEELGIDT